MSPRRRPLYARMLRLRHLKLRPALAFLFLEGSIATGVLLALADIVNGWGIVAVPVAVAAMVKLNDVLAGILAPVPQVAPVGGPPPVVSAEAPVPPQNRATQPIRGASMRRTRAIVGRARPGSARGIVYIRPEPPEARRPGSVSATAALPSSTPASRPEQAPEPAGESVNEPPGEITVRVPAERAPIARPRGRTEDSPEAAPSRAEESPTVAGLDLAAVDPPRTEPGDDSAQVPEAGPPENGPREVGPREAGPRDRNKGRFA